MVNCAFSVLSKLFCLTGRRDQANGQGCMTGRPICSLPSPPSPSALRAAQDRHAGGRLYTAVADPQLRAAAVHRQRLTHWPRADNGHQDLEAFNLLIVPFPFHIPEKSFTRFPGAFPGGPNERVFALDPTAWMGRRLLKNSRISCLA
jgi:hypothetical protein